VKSLTTVSGTRMSLGRGLCPGRHGRPGSADPPGDGVDRADDRAGV